MEISVNSLDGLSQVAKTVLQTYPKDRIFLFYGSMGAGKTTFIKALCTELGVYDSTSSPTFSIVNEYHSLQGTIYHFDFYRLKNEQEAFDMGYEEYFYSGAYCFVEWPERIPHLIPEMSREVQIIVTEDDIRKITVN